MAILREFKDFVEQKDKISIKIMLKNNMLVDPTLTQFNEMVNYANSKMNLFDIHDGKELIYDSSNWNKQYLAQEMVRVIDNFSKERVDLLKRIVQYLYLDKSKVVYSDVNNQSTFETRFSDKDRKNIIKTCLEWVKSCLKWLKDYFCYGNKSITSICKCCEKMLKIIDNTNYLSKQSKINLIKYTEQIIENCGKILGNNINLKTNTGYKKNINEEVKQQLYNICEIINHIHKFKKFTKKQIYDIAQSAYKIQVLLE